MTTVAELDATALASAMIAPPAIPAPAKTPGDPNRVRIAFYRADASSGARANHIMADVMLGDDLGVVSIDTNDPAMITAAEASALRSLIKRVILAAWQKKQADAAALINPPAPAP